MFGSNKVLIPISALILLFSAASFAEPSQQISSNDQLNAQMKELQTQIVSANQRIAALEAHNKLEEQISTNLFIQSSESLHGRNR